MSGHLWRRRPPASRTARTRLGAYTPRAEAQRGHLEDRLRSDRRAHLRGAPLAVAEHDRDLAHLEAGLDRAVGQLDLEAVAVGVDAVEVERLEHLPPEALEAAGQV